MEEKSVRSEGMEAATIGYGIRRTERDRRPLRLLERMPIKSDDLAMSRPSWLQKIYWSHLAKPAQERALFKVLLDKPISSVLEIGVGDGSRMGRIAKLVQLAAGTEQLRYIGVDEFESAKDGRRHLTLKQAHQCASLNGFKASLIPGDLTSALPRVAHKLGASDLIIIDGGVAPEQLSSGPFGTWIHHLTHENSIVLASSTAGNELKAVSIPAQPQTVRSAA